MSPYRRKRKERTLEEQAAYDHARLRKAEENLRAGIQPETETEQECDALMEAHRWDVVKLSVKGGAPKGMTAGTPDRRYRFISGDDWLQRMGLWWEVKPEKGPKAQLTRAQFGFLYDEMRIGNPAGAGHMAMLHDCLRQVRSYGPKGGGQEVLRIVAWRTVIKVLERGLRDGTKAEAAALLQRARVFE